MLFFLVVLGVAGCSTTTDQPRRPGFLARILPGPEIKSPSVESAVAEALDGVLESDADPLADDFAAPDKDARTVDEFDTTSAAARSAALEKDITPQAPGDGRLLGVSIASLGDPAQVGFWLKTPLVTTEQPGRAVFAETERSVQVQLIPSGGSVGSGSQLSLAAMRLLEAPLTGLVELSVYAEGS